MGHYYLTMDQGEEDAVEMPAIRLSDHPVSPTRPHVAEGLHPPLFESTASCIVNFPSSAPFMSSPATSFDSCSSRSADSGRRDVMKSFLEMIPWGPKDGVQSTSLSCQGSLTDQDIIGILPEQLPVNNASLLPPYTDTPKRKRKRSPSGTASDPGQSLLQEVRLSVSKSVTDFGHPLSPRLLFKDVQRSERDSTTSTSTRLATPPNIGSAQARISILVEEEGTSIGVDPSGADDIMEKFQPDGNGSGSNLNCDVLAKEDATSTITSPTTEIGETHNLSILLTPPLATSPESHVDHMIGLTTNQPSSFESSPTLCLAMAAATSIQADPASPTTSDPAPVFLPLDQPSIVPLDNALESCRERLASQDAAPVSGPPDDPSNSHRGPSVCSSLDLLHLFNGAESRDSDGSSDRCCPQAESSQAAIEAQLQVDRLISSPSLRLSSIRIQADQARRELFCSFPSGSHHDSLVERLRHTMEEDKSSANYRSGRTTSTSANNHIHSRIAGKTKENPIDLTVEQEASIDPHRSHSLQISSSPKISLASSGLEIPLHHTPMQKRREGTPALQQSIASPAASPRAVRRDDALPLLPRFPPDSAVFSCRITISEHGTFTLDDETLPHTLPVYEHPIESGNPESSTDQSYRSPWTRISESRRGFGLGGTTARTSQARQGEPAA